MHLSHVVLGLASLAALGLAGLALLKGKSLAKAAKGLECKTCGDLVKAKDKALEEAKKAKDSSESDAAKLLKDAADKLDKKA